MLTTTKNFLLGENGNKGVLVRSGIITALMTTVFVVITGLADGDVWGTLASQKETLMPMWVAALLAIFGNPSKKSQ